MSGLNVSSFFFFLSFTTHLCIVLALYLRPVWHIRYLCRRLHAIHFPQLLSSRDLWDPKAYCIFYLRHSKPQLAQPAIYQTKWPHLINASNSTISHKKTLHNFPTLTQFLVAVACWRWNQLCIFIAIAFLYLRRIQYVIYSRISIVRWIVCGGRVVRICVILRRGIQNTVSRKDSKTKKVRIFINNNKKSFTNNWAIKGLTKFYICMYQNELLPCTGD